MRRGFSPDPHVLAHPLVMEHCDNLMVRYLCSSKVYERVTSQHLDQAIENLTRLDQILFNDNFAEGCHRLFVRIGKDCPEIRASNRKRSSSQVFTELPEGMHHLVKYDLRLYEAATRLAVTW